MLRGMEDGAGRRGAGPEEGGRGGRGRAFREVPYHFYYKQIFLNNFPCSFLHVLPRDDEDDE